MAAQISTLFSYIRIPLSTGPLSRGVKFKHISAPGSPPATSLLRRHINAAAAREKFPAAPAALRTGSAPSAPRGRRAWLRALAVGVALGASTVALAQPLHTGTLAAMAYKVNLSSAEGSWEETKDILLSAQDRRQYYRTKHVPLDDIPVWTPTAVSGGSEKAYYPRNEKLDGKISVYSGDITMLEIDAIVNAANKTLMGGGGVDGAIHRVAGPLLKKECASLNGCETGEAKISGGYGLPAKHVIHTVGPIAHGGVGEAERNALSSCYQNSLEEAARSGVRSVAFPCISTGIFGYPPEKAVHVALATVRDFLEKHPDKMDRVIFCVFLPTDKELYLHNLPLYFPAATTVKSKL